MFESGLLRGGAVDVGLVRGGLASDGIFGSSLEVVLKFFDMDCFAAACCASVLVLEGSCGCAHGGVGSAVVEALSMGSGDLTSPLRVRF